MTNTLESIDFYCILQGYSHGNGLKTFLYAVETCLGDGIIRSRLNLDAVSARHVNKEVDMQKIN